MSAFSRSKAQGKKKQSRKKKPIEKSRKEIRKEERKRKKLAKVEYFQRRKERQTKLKTGDKQEDVREAHKKKDNEQAKQIQEREKQLAKEKKEKKLQRERAKQRKRQLVDDNHEEDRVIKKLEKQLKLNKRNKKNIPKSFAADGLDYLLDFCVEENRKQAVETEMQLAQVDTDMRFDEDLALLTGRDKEKDRESEATYDDDDDDDDADSSGHDDNESIVLSEENSDADNSEYLESSSFKNKKHKTTKMKKEIAQSDDSEENEDSGEEDILSDIDDNNEDDVTDNDKDNSQWEDIYGRKRDKSGNIIPDTTKYRPPAARAANKKLQNNGDENIIVLKKKLKGCINRVAENNMHNIVNQIDELYMSNSRNDMNDLLSKLLMEALVSPVLTPDRLISEHMMLIAILHANVGIEVGAHFLEILVKKCIDMMQQSQDVENKELDNLILMFSHLYNFKVYGNKLVYEILEKLLEKFTEKEIELILLVLKTIGFPLRKDDPIALKEFIQKVQQKASQEKIENSRVKFMLDVLLAIKNNNMNKIPQYDPSHVEHLKKVIKSVIRKGNSITQFNVSLEDLLKVDERGKWWVVGSAWTGSGDVDHPSNKSKDKKLVFGSDILELARKQRMNTETRKNIFCVLMTAEDYLDAFEKLHHLGLKDKQEREVIHVLMHCCLQEKNFNPYYAILAEKFCEYDRKYQLTIQYTLWDRLKTLEMYTTKQLCNLACFLTHLFVKKSLPFSILKVIQFAELDKQTMRLVRQIMLGVLLTENEDACLQVFERISLSPRLQNFRESLRLFINHFLLKNINARQELSDTESLLKKRTELIDKILTSKASRIVF